MTYQTDAQRDWAAEDAAGAAGVPAPTKEEERAILLALDAENTSGEEDDPECEWCGEVVPNGESAYAPYCSALCELEARR